MSESFNDTSSRHGDGGWRTASEAVTGMRAGELSAEMFIDECLARIEHREDVVGAWTYLEKNQALEAARACDRKRGDGPLEGIPIAVKDIIDTADMPTCYGTRIYEGYRPAGDASCVAMLRAAGAILLGKTVTTELAYFQPGKTRNPHGPDHTPGGSSSGSAAAVADGMVPIGLGTQTAASVTRPAAYCGVVGYKSSVGAFSLSGIKGFGHSLDSLGWMARSVEDVALVWACLNGMAPVSTTRQESPPSIGLCRTPHWGLASAAQQEAVERTARKLEELGARVVEVSLPGSFDELADTHKTVMAYEAHKNYAYEWMMRRPLLSKPLQALLESGESCSYDGYRAAMAHAKRCSKEFRDAIEGLDVLLAPSAAGEAPLVRDGTGDPLFSRMWTLLGVPSVTIPVARGEAGLPLGAQLIGRLGDDRQLISQARWVEAGLGVSRDMRPL